MLYHSKFSTCIPCSCCFVCFVFKINYFNTFFFFFLFTVCTFFFPSRPVSKLCTLELCSRLTDLLLSLWLSSFLIQRSSVLLTWSLFSLRDIQTYVFIHLFCLNSRVTAIPLPGLYSSDFVLLLVPYNFSSETQHRLYFILPLPPLQRSLALSLIFSFRQRTSFYFFQAPSFDSYFIPIYSAFWLTTFFADPSFCSVLALSTDILSVMIAHQIKQGAIPYYFAALFGIQVLDSFYTWDKKKSTPPPHFNSLAPQSGWLQQLINVES